MCGIVVFEPTIFICPLSHHWDDWPAFFQCPPTASKDSLDTQKLQDSRSIIHGLSQNREGRETQLGTLIVISWRILRQFSIGLVWSFKNLAYVPGGGGLAYPRTVTSRSWRVKCRKHTFVDSVTVSGITFCHCLFGVLSLSLGTEK